MKSLANKDEVSDTAAVDLERSLRDSPCLNFHAISPVLTHCGNRVKLAPPGGCSYGKPGQMNPDRICVALLFTVAVIFSECGCSSFFGNGIGLATSSASPYMGLRGDLDEIAESVQGPPSVEKAARGIGSAIDAPFSAALDTLLLPLTIPQHRANVAWANLREPPIDEERVAREREIMNLHQTHMKATIENGAPPILIDGVPQPAEH